MTPHVCLMTDHINRFSYLNTLIQNHGISNNYDAVKNYALSVSNVRIVCGRRFPLQLGVVLVFIFLFLLHIDKWLHSQKEMNQNNALLCQRLRQNTFHTNVGHTFSAFQKDMNIFTRRLWNLWFKSYRLLYSRNHYY